MEKTMSGEEQITVEVPDTTSTVVSAGANKPTREEAIKERGWTSEEADKAEKHGLLKKPEEPKTETVTEKKEETKAEAKPPVVERRRLADHEFEMTPEQEAKFHEIFPAGTKPSAFFTAARIERLKRQQAVREVDELRKQLADRDAKLSMVQQPKTKVEVDEHGNEIDPADKPLTRRQLEELAVEQEEKRRKMQEEANSKAERSAEAHKQQEELARATYPDFDDALKLAGDLAQNIQDLIPDARVQKRAYKLMAEFKEAVGRAEEIGPDEFNAADIAYELARLHPNYGKKAEDAHNGTLEVSDPKTKGNGGQKFSPEQLKRLADNTQRRASSASIPGGNGKTSVAPDEVTLEQLNRMNSEQRSRFREKYPDHYSKLLRG
jgi:hypothetical protein